MLANDILDKLCHDILDRLFTGRSGDGDVTFSFNHHQNDKTTSGSVYYYSPKSDGKSRHLYGASIIDGKLFLHLHMYDQMDLSFDLANPKFDFDKMQKRFEKLSSICMIHRKNHWRIRRISNELKIEYMS